MKSGGIFGCGGNVPMCRPIPRPRNRLHTCTKKVITRLERATENALSLSKGNRLYSTPEVVNLQVLDGRRYPGSKCVNG